MLSSVETPRLLPPAKARKANAAMQALLKTPPPAYGTPFVFPEQRHRQHNILGSPMVSTYQMVGWAGDYEGIEDEELPIADEVVNEKSREELKELLVKAGQIIKQRENGKYLTSLLQSFISNKHYCTELGVTSAVCKGLHSNNIALKSKHEALLARLPDSPPRSTSSPANLYHQAMSREGSISIPTSFSDSAIDVTGSPEISYHHARKVSIATADISLLADQNAELLDKLENLEMGATHADQVGRRELKRLEKEIEFLREALEKTQERSEELESKVEGAMANEAWRRKKEREAKFRAMRNPGRDNVSSSPEIRNFAPEGSNFGGPSQAFRFLSTAESSDPYDSSDGTSRENGSNSNFPQLTSPEHNIVAQLLTKVKELEETNTRILQQQSETADQLSAVQRDTAHITRVYDCLSDPQYTQLEFNHNYPEDEYDREQHHARTPVGQTIRFVSLRRNIEDDMDILGTSIVHPKYDAMFSTTKRRKSVMGLFVDEHASENNPRQDGEEETSSEFDARLREHLSFSSWDGGDNYSSWSSHPDMDHMPQRPSLSPLHFFSPPSRHVAELSPVETHATLQHELMREFGEGASWEAAANAGRGSADRELHLRTSSLYDLGQFSVPPSPSPPQRVISRRGSEELDFEAIRRVDKDVDTVDQTDGTGASAPSSGLLMPMNTLQLSVQPPTPEKRRLVDYTRSGYDNADRDRPAATSSPRVQKISEVLRARSERWSLDRRLRPRTSFMYDSVHAGRPTPEKGGQLANLREQDGNTNSDFSRFGEIDNNLTVNTSASDPSNDIMTVQQPSVPRRLMDAVDSMIDGFAGSAADIRDAIVLNYDDQDGITTDEKEDDGDSDDDSAREVYHSAPGTPELRPRPLRHRRSGLSNASPPGQTYLGDEDNMRLHPRSAASSPQRATQRVTSEGSLMLRVWLWIQFTIVVFVFLYTMARRGPGVVLTDGDNKRGAMARHRHA